MTKQLSYSFTFLDVLPRRRNSLPMECFPVTYDLNGFTSRINTPFNCRFFLNRLSACLNLFVLLFLVTPYLVVAVQPCME